MNQHSKFDFEIDSFGGRDDDGTDVVSDFDDGFSFEICEWDVDAVRGRLEVIVAAVETRREREIRWRLEAKKVGGETETDGPSEIGIHREMRIVRNDRSRTVRVSMAFFDLNTCLSLFVLIRFHVKILAIIFLSIQANFAFSLSYILSSPVAPSFVSWRNTQKRHSQHSTSLQLQL